MEENARLIVVSNRLPLTLRRSGERCRAERSSGGLVTALDPVFQRSEGLWVGWPGESHEPGGPDCRPLLERWERERGFASVHLPRAIANGFYNGYPNQALWPLFHGFASWLEFHPKSWPIYEEANRLFAEAVRDRLRPGDRIWVHDYHLLLLPRLLREFARDHPIGFFLHIPFPSTDLFRLLPKREELLEGLLGADCIAFQTHSHLQHFRSALLRVLGLESEMDRVSVDGRQVRLEALPIGIVPDEFTRILDEDPEAQRLRRELEKRYEGRRLLLSVDRLDYTKGIPERLRAFRRLLEDAPELRGEIVLLQVAVPSRERIPRYRELRRQVNELVGEINGHFATPNWTPVVYIRRSIPRRELVALYATAAVGWVTPLRDGMNLVAKEYVTCQRGGQGALLLSEFAGAAAEMGEAFLVNPYDEEQTAAVLRRALSSPAEELCERMGALYRRVIRNDARTWSERFLRSLDRAAAARGPERPGTLPELPEAAARESLSGREHMLLLDYDGTLVPLTAHPAEARPPEELRALLGQLARQPGHRVAIVSSRTAPTLERWLGDLPGLWLAAENGAMVRDPAGRRWEPLHPTLAAQWKERVLPVLEHYVDRTPGSYIEEKDYSLVWHYPASLSEPAFAEWITNELLATLADLLSETDLTVVRARRSVEVRHTWATKAEVVSRLEASGPPPDFRLAIGDDRADEDLFARLPPDAWTVHVGDGPSRARYRLPNPRAVRSFLADLVRQH